MKRVTVKMIFRLLISAPPNGQVIFKYLDRITWLITLFGPISTTFKPAFLLHVTSK